MSFEHFKESCHRKGFEPVLHDILQKMIAPNDVARSRAAARLLRIASTGSIVSAFTLGPPLQRVETWICGKRQNPHLPMSFIWTIEPRFVTTTSIHEPSSTKLIYLSFFVERRLIGSGRSITFCLTHCDEGNDFYTVVEFVFVTGLMFHCMYVVFAFLLSYFCALSDDFMLRDFFFL